MPSARLLVLPALMLSSLAWPSVAAAQAPTAPVIASASVVEDGARAATLDLAWTAAAEADGVVVTYVIDVAEAGRPTVTISVPGTVSTARVTGVRRAANATVSITAVDEVGERSASGSTILPVPALPVALALTMDRRACRGLAGACTVLDLDARTVRVTLSGGSGLEGTQVRLELSHRAPGARRLVDAGVRTGRTGDARPLARFVRSPGTWCIRGTLVDADDLAVAPATPTCVRWRPLVELGWAGDIVIGSHYGLPPDGGRTQFSAVAALLRAPDLMIGNYEGTLSRGGTARCSGGPLCFIFQGPPERARNLRVAGFDVMNLANNHALDMGSDARRQTVRALTRVGLGVAGLPNSVTVRQVADTRVAIVGLTPYPGTSSLRQPAVIRSLVHRARRAGDVVVVCVHVGLEGAAGAHVPRGADYGTQTRAALHEAIDAGADVVFGSGPHVVRGVERYRGRYIVYSSGNFAGWHTFGIGGLTAQSGVVRMRFDYRGRPSAGAWDPVVLDGPGIPRPDRSGRVIRRVASLSRDDFGSAGARFTRSGTFR